MTGVKRRDPGSFWCCQQQEREQWAQMVTQKVPYEHDLELVCFVGDRTGKTAQRSCEISCSENIQDQPGHLLVQPTAGTLLYWGLD